MSACGNCPEKHTLGPGTSDLVQLGARADYVVALAGNPNTGKSTIFNHLTGLRQHTGNWPGKTVSRAEGHFTHAGKRFKLVDLPGTYSLLSDSTDEEIARDFVLFGQPDCTVVVCDATLLERNLLLTLQVMDITDRVVVCTNLMDEAGRKRIDVNTRLLEEELGVPVVATAARRGRGIDSLVRTIAEVASGKRRARPNRVPLDAAVGEAVETLVAQLREALPGLPCPRWVAMRLLDGDERMERAVADGELAALFCPSSRDSADEAAA